MTDLPTYTPVTDSFGNPHMEPVPVGCWVRAEDARQAISATITTAAEIARNIKPDPLSTKLAKTSSSESAWVCGGDHALMRASDAILDLHTQSSTPAQIAAGPRVQALVDALMWYDDPSSQGDVARAALAAFKKTEE